jgi:hypothetical protein
MLTQKTQNFQKSCGAACSLVARIELGAQIPLTDAQETVIYQQLRIPLGQLGASEILPDSIVYYMRQSGHHADIIESPITANVLLPAMGPILQGMYALYTNGVNARHYHKAIRDTQDSDFFEAARLLLVVKFADQNLLHYVLARKGDFPNSNQCYIMNPDPGSDDAISLPGVGNYFTTNISDPAGKRRYRYLGIAIRVW